MKLGCQGLVKDPLFSEAEGIDIPSEAAKRIIRCCLPTMLNCHISSKGQVYVECLATTQASVLKCLSVVDLDPVRLLSLAKALADGQMPVLEKFEIRTSDLHSEGIDWICQAIEKGACRQLHTLRITNAGEAEYVKRLMKALIQSQDIISLKELGLSLLRSAAMLHVAEGIEMGALDDLESIELANCEIGDEGLTILSQAWKRRPSCSSKLTKLCLDFILVGDEGIKSFAEALAAGGLPYLQELTLVGNEAIGDDGFMALCEALLKGAGKNLQVLDVKLCDVGNAGVKALIRAIQGGACVDLSKLDLRCKRVDGKVAAALAGVLAAGACRNLQSLKFSSLISKEAQEIISAFMEGAKRAVCFS